MYNDIAARIAAARRDLEKRMAAVGLTRDRGWAIQERVVDGGGGVLWILVPIHAKEPAPGGLRGTVSIDREGNIRE